MKINGQYQFEELQRLVVNNTWIMDNDSFPLDRYGNEVMPMPKEHRVESYIFAW